MVTYWYIDGMYKNTLVSYRNFYGVIRVIEKDEKGWPSTAYQLLHGITIHGVQLEEKTQRKLSAAYYSENSGVGLAILNHPERGKGMSIGVCRLGVGILAVHISNHHLDLVPVVWNLADHFKLARVLIDDPGTEITAIHSIWMLLSPDPGLLNVPEITGRSTPMEKYKTNIRMWTDDYSNLFQILK